jgi:hypothetical protein
MQTNIEALGKQESYNVDVLLTRNSPIKCCIY